LNRESFREEVSRFRSSFKEDAFAAAEKSLTLQKKGAVGLIVFDQFQEKANKLSTPNMLRLFDLFTQIENDKEIGCVVVVSRKPTIFIAGADISEIQKMASGEVKTESLMKLQAVFTYLETLPVPSIAAIHGACMGGGLELSAACDYRMVSDAPETKLAVPEVMLGVIPGWGGTQRLPRLLGLANSLDLILTGKTVDGRKAKKIGLADKIAPKEILEEKALAWAAELAKTRKKRNKDERKADLKERLLEAVPGGKKLVFDQARKQVLSKSKGNYPAPLKAIEVIRKTYGGKVEDGLKVEAQAFMELVATPQSRHLIEVYYLNERVKKDKGTQSGAAAREVKRAGVLGAGVMGGGIAQLFAAKDVRVRMKDVQWDAIAKGFKAAHRIFAKQVERKKMRPNELANAMERIEGTTTYDGFHHLDLVVEAVVENLDVKKKVFQELEAKTAPETILATNTSSLSISLIAQAVKNPARVVGMHFFNPVDKMPLVEIIRGKDTSDEAVATIFQFSKRLGKTPIVVKDAPGFVVNRILAPYLNEAVFLLMEGVPPTKLDEVMEKFGMPMGPATLLDEVGLDVGAKVSKILYGAFGERMKPPALMEKVVEAGRLGKKNGKGVYLYQDGGRKRVPDPAFWSGLGVKENPSAVPDDQIVKRLTYLMVNEAARCIEEGLVRDISDVDVGMIYGTGFAPFRGGLLRYADDVGPEAIVAELEILTRNLGPRFQPAAYLQQLAVGNKKFYA
jgi:3-hydroxyacyl-CoA dehydrogenase/enoyl-CoA hydratase/3-hydroxybutyryl-CoA epimerase